MDPCDIGSEREQELREDAIAAARRANANRPQPNGACHWCAEEVGPGKVFCDADCADDYQWHENAKHRNGR